MKRLPMVYCSQCQCYVEFTPDEVVEKRWNQMYVVNCLCKTQIRLSDALFRSLGLHEQKQEEAPPPPVKEEAPEDYVKRAIETATLVKKLGSKAAAAKEMGVSAPTVTNYLKYLPADYGTEE